MMTSTTGATLGHVEPRLSATARQLTGKATVRHGLVAIGSTQLAVPGAVELTVAAVQQIQLRVSERRVDFTVKVTVFVA